MTRNVYGLFVSLTHVKNEQKWSVCLRLIKCIYLTHKFNMQLTSTLPKNQAAGDK